MKLKYDYIVIDGNKFPNELWCKRGDERLEIPNMLPIDVYIAFTNAFLKIHKSCKAK
jgi:hypothetical protein